MKLYTEEQVRRAMGAGMHIGYSNQFNIDNITNEVDKAIKYLTPIELPSDDEMANASNHCKDFQMEVGFLRGVLWLKEQILNQKQITYE